MHRDPELRRRYQNQYYKSTAQKERRAARQKEYWLRSRTRLFTRDNYMCHYCHRKFHERDLHIDHKIPRALGGTNTDDNKVTACRWCNRVKSAKPTCAQCQTWATPELLNDGTVRCVRCHALNSFPEGTKTVPVDAEPEWITEEETADESGDLGN